ncbi:MAG: alpha-rhamnosidase [Ruminococcaceae bacterium]|nr:alpha-rhamnosidase [Oscillospiraceae bacterium]
MHKQSFWIWHYGDYEIFHTMELNLRREVREKPYPPFWRLSTPNVSVKFTKDFNCENNTKITVHANGEGYVSINAEKFSFNEEITLQKGSYTITVNVFKKVGLPSIFVESDIIPSNGSWYSKLSDSNKPMPVGFDTYYDSIEKNPETFSFEYSEIAPISAEIISDGVLYDFGKETFACLNIDYADSNQKMSVYYGESREEALDFEHTYILENISKSSYYRLKSRAFRYIFIKGATTSLKVTADYEYLPLKYRGNFCCDNQLFNQIWETSAYTFHLNCREGFMDGIKRDRWIWQGDAYQSSKINNYLFFDDAIEKRTAIGILGNEPFCEHINTIIDYTLFWIIGLYDYYFTHGDITFIKNIFPKAEKLMEFIESRLNDEGFIVGRSGDWTFIDWSDIDKTGAISAEQMLLIAVYNSFAKIKQALNLDPAKELEKAKTLTEKVNYFFWDSQKGGFIDSYESGKRNVTRHANIFAIMYGIATPKQIESIKNNVLKNDNITKITTPYFEGYELDVLGKLGEYCYIENMLENYWGGMLKLGATTFWEEFDPTKNGIEHYAMYGGKYEKSLCHAWGANPIYLFGRYYLGVYPTSPGFETFKVEPNLGGLKKFEGTVPTKNGEVKIYLDSTHLKVTATQSGGTLIFNDKKYALEKNKELIIEVI